MNMSTSNSDDLIRQEVFRIGAKLDAMPQVYVMRNEYAPWVLSVEKRFDDNNKRFDEIDKLKTDGAKFAMEERSRIHTQIQETERHLQEKQDKISDQVSDIYEKLSKKIDDKQEKQDTKHDATTQNIWTWRQTWMVFGATTLIGAIEFIVQYMAMHH